MHQLTRLTDSILFLFIISILFFTSCDSKQEKENPDPEGIQNAELTDKADYLEVTEKIPTDIIWETNDSAPIFSSSEAMKGGTYRTAITMFPLTLRAVGPDSNGGFRSFLDANKMSLLYLHPNTEELLPSLATHWAFWKDKKTMFFKLNSKAKWSDGRAVTANDYLYTLKFMRSKFILAPWYNNYYTEKLDRIIKYDDYTIAVVAKNEDPDLFLINNMGPTPRHFYGQLNVEFVKNFNWKITPNTGPYQISDIKKGKSITFKRKENWWAKDLKYNLGRFNVDKVLIKVIREQTTLFEFFKRQKLDDFSLVFPNYWHGIGKNMESYEKGYVKKLWFYTDTRESATGFWLNMDKEIFKDRNVRYAFAHGMNIDKMLRTLLRGDYRRLHNHMTGYGKYSDTSIVARKFSVTKVDSLMKKSGWQRGKDGIWEKGKKKYSVKVNYSFDGHTPRLVLLKEEAKKVGIELILQLKTGTSFKQILERKHDVAWMGWSTGFRPRYRQHYHSENAHKTQTNNITNTDDPDMDRYIEAYRSSIDPNERIKLSHKIQNKIHEIGAFIPTYYVGYERLVYWRWWKFPKVPATKNGGVIDPFGSGTFWLDPKIKEKTLQAMKSGKTFEPELLIDKTFKKQKMANEILLDVNQLTTVFHTEMGIVNAVEEVEFQVKKGSTLGIVGESGCGKSVTSLSIMRLLPQPSGVIKSGEIFLDGRDLLKIPIKDMRNIRGNQISMIFQEPMTALNPVHRIEQQLREVFEIHQKDLDKKSILKTSIELLNMVGIPAPEQKINEFPHQLSGGMRQRVMIAIALACKPKLLIADEPTTALDVTIQAQILDLMKELQTENGMSIIFITHDLGVIAETCDEVLVMYAGKIVEKAKVEDLFESAKHPYTQGLLASIPSLNTVSKQKLPTIPGSVPDLFSLPKGCRFQNRCFYAKDKCKNNSPQMESVSESHKVSCFYWKEIKMNS